MVEVDLAGSQLFARIWRAQVGRIPLYLLDTSVEENDELERGVTDRLYGGDTEHRLRQEILLGVGGVRALEAVGETPHVFHSNEGHAGFLGLERIRRAIAGGLSFDEAVEAVRAGTVFTTHTPVPAGIDRFPRPLMERYFKAWADECDVSFDTLMALGHVPDEPADAPFNMAVMGLRLAGFSNGVSKLHGQVSRQIFQPVWPGVPTDELPIGSITNGVHTRTWVSPRSATSSTATSCPSGTWPAPTGGPASTTWATTSCGGPASRPGSGWWPSSASGCGPRRSPGACRRPTSTWLDDAFNPNILTIGFARRFAPYKRATLLLSQPDRLARLLLDADRPMQLLFAGKAHPADDPGKEIIRQVVQFTRHPDVRHRVAFVEDYDIGVARMMYQGCDVWLNTPRRPMEACGTSGEKAALNGALNCSILDGWWDELYDGTNGWAIPSAETVGDQHLRDQLEAGSLFDLLERQIVPLYYEANPGRPPSRWLSRVRRSLRTLGPEVTASRMVRDYVERMYEPAATHGEALVADGYARAKALAAWKRRVLTMWTTVAVKTVDETTAAADLGGDRTVAAVADLGQLGPDDVQVQVVHGPVGNTDEIVDAAASPHGPGGAGDGPYRYEGTFTCDRPGRYGFTVRVVPSHPDLLTWAELGCMAVA